MGLIGGIGLVAAFKNYLEAKKAYDEAIDREKELLTAVQANIKTRDLAYEGVEQYSDPNKPLEGVEATTVLRVGNLANVRPFNRVQVAVILTNNTDKTYWIRSVAAEVRVDGAGIPTTTTQKRYTNLYLKPGKTLTIDLPGSKTILPAVTKQTLKDAICAACKRSLITSCWKVKISGDDLETADVRIYYTSQSGADKEKTAYYKEVQGTVNYMGEAFYPKEQ